ncbi:MAG: methyltransferase domain-containing protein, partial [Rhodobacterales bacterium]|nr:methyltransferase domain-containing protein [Rhodobacterales bacterium]
RRPLPSVADRANVRGVSLAPLAIWSLESQTGPNHWKIADRLGLAEHYIPNEPVHLDGPVCLWGPPQQGDTLAARIVQTPTGWVALPAFVFPGAPPGRLLHSWLNLLLWEARLNARYLPIEAVLGRRGHRMVRLLAEWSSARGRNNPYDNAELYDLEYADHTEDLAWYTSLAKKFGGPILELGCGTGRLTLPIARTGAKVIGVDLSQPMLDGLAQRVAADSKVQDKVQTHLGDFRTLDLDRQFPLVLWPFNALHHCRDLEQVSAVLARISRHMGPTSRLAMDCYLPARELYEQDPNEEVEPRTFVDARGQTLTSWEQTWWEPELKVHHVVYTYVYPDGTTKRSHLQLRMYELAEVKQAIHDAGFEILLEARNFQNNPVTERSLKWVALLKKR